MAAKKPLNITDGSRSVPMTIILLAWPVFIEQVFTPLVSFADTAYFRKQSLVSIEIQLVFCYDKVRILCERTFYIWQSK